MMMETYHNFYRKYRPKTFLEVIGQETVVTILKNLLKSKKLHHGYLFSGMQGVGKTSLARIFARSINCLAYQGESYCQKCPVCQANEKSLHDIIEIDGASHNGVEEILDLQAKSFIAPQISPYKVYIIDEVHMLSKSAFNAFLKLLEEPPRHIIFILATTELHKIPHTIISRCQHFFFPAISQAKLVALLEKIASQEKLSFNLPALETIASFAAGSVRDSLNLLEQIAAFRPKELIDSLAVNNYFGYLKADHYFQFFQQIFILNKVTVWKMLTTFSQTNLEFNCLVLLEKMIVTLKNHLYNVFLFEENQTWEKESIKFSIPSYFQWTNETLQKVLELVFSFLPYFRYKQLKPLLLLEILILNIFALLKKDDFSTRESRWGLAILSKRTPEKLVQIKKQWTLLKNYQNDSQLKKLVKIFSSSQPVACSPFAILLKADNLAVKNNLNNFLEINLFKELSYLLLGKNYHFFALTGEELQLLKEKYLKN